MRFRVGFVHKLTNAPGYAVGAASAVYILVDTLEQFVVIQSIGRSSQNWSMVSPCGHVGIDVTWNQASDFDAKWSQL